MATTLREWVLVRLEAARESARVVVRDPLRLLSEADAHRFAQQHGLTAIVAATNLVFRELYEQAIEDSETCRLLVLDQASARRRTSPRGTTAPPPFYPDVLAETPPEARIELSLQRYLKEATGDPHWPLETDDPHYARLIVRHLAGVLRAHQNLRTAHPGRFTDQDFRAIVAAAALGIAESAFKRLDAEDYWKIGLLGHEALAELDLLLPEVTGPIREQLRQAPAPFCWFGDHDADTVIRAFYLSAILAQHLDNWALLLANVDPSLAPLSGIGAELLRNSAPKLVALDPAQANRDLEAVEQSLDRDALQFLLLDQMKLTEPARFASAIVSERYSTLVRSLALLLALDDLLSAQPAQDEHARVAAALFPEASGGEPCFADTRPAAAWSDLKEAYRLARDVQVLRVELAAATKQLKVLKTDQLTYELFRKFWNEKRVNRLEYYLSALERLVDNRNLLPRDKDALPSTFENALDRIRQRVRATSQEVDRQIDELNLRFQEMIAAQYPGWVAKDGHVRLTSQFLRRCLKPNWDPQSERAVLLVFDGMRYDIWDELLKPMLVDRMELIADLPASSLLPSETHITRKAICAGAYADEFDSRAGEDKLLKAALARELGFTAEVEVLTPEGAGTGETVRYRAGKLDVYIFELCDKELHKITVKTRPDGRDVPSRPLAFIYEQHLKDIIDTEVMAIVRGLPAGTKVFVTADHGFGRVGREPLWFNKQDLNELQDCSYLNCLLRVPIGQADVPGKVRANVVAFTPEQIRMPKEETRTLKAGATLHKEYGAVVFPRVGYSFSRQDSHYNPDAYSHGGISIQELVIPMAVLRVKPREEGLLALGALAGPSETVEGEEIEFRMVVKRAGVDGPDEVRVEVDATYGREPGTVTLPHQVLYVPAEGLEVVYRFRPDPHDATDEERRAGSMARVLAVAVSYRDGRRTVRKSQTHRFAVQLNSERILRRVGNLGNILGLVPRSIR